MIIGLMATIVIPNLQQRLPGYQRKAFLSELNNLLALGWQNSLITQKVHRVFFDTKKRIIKLEIEDPAVVTTGFKSVPQTFRKTYYEIPPSIEIKDFFLDGVNEYRPDREVLTFWFFIVPEGMSQEVVMNMIDTSGTPQVHIGLVLNPFTVQLKEYDTFQKP